MNRLYARAVLSSAVTAATRHFCFSNWVGKGLLPRTRSALTDGDALIGGLSQVVAQIDMAQSNSIIEARGTKLDIRNNNGLIPRADLGGRAPDEAFFGLETVLPERLRVGHEAARVERLPKNRKRRCGVCLAKKVRSPRFVESAAHHMPSGPRPSDRFIALAFEGMQEAPKPVAWRICVNGIGLEHRGAARFGLVFGCEE